MKTYQEYQPPAGVLITAESAGLAAGGSSCVFHSGNGRAAGPVAHHRVLSASDAAFAARSSHDDGAAFVRLLRRCAVVAQD